jgi:spore coat polysaccharide biosynthesis protein SpsF (cytidylyltransferase family)
MFSGVLAIVQARMGSSRLPGKSFELISGYPVFEICLRRLEYARLVSDIILATTDSPKDDLLARHAKRIGYNVFRGSEDDLVSRFYEAAKGRGYENILRVTADNVFVDWDSIDLQIKTGIEGDFDFVTWKNPVYPERNNDFAGEFISFSALERVHLDTCDPFEREHVYPHFLRNPDKFKVNYIEIPKELQTSIKLDLDEFADLVTIRSAAEASQSVLTAPAWKLVKIARRQSLAEGYLTATVANI